MTPALLDDPIFLKVATGVALYLLGNSRSARWGGLALAAWGGWQYWQAPKVIYKAPAADPGLPALVPAVLPS